MLVYSWLIADSVAGEREGGRKRDREEGALTI